MEVLEVNIDDPQPNDYNPNLMDKSTFKFLVKEIRKRGMVQPILVNKDYVIIDGEHRWRAAKEAGLKTIHVVLIDMELTEAQVQTINMNLIKGEFDPGKFADLLTSLLSAHEKEALAKLINMPEKELDELMRLGELDFEIPFTDKDGLGDAVDNEITFKFAFKDFEKVIGKIEVIQENMGCDKNKALMYGLGLLKDD